MADLDKLQEGVNKRIGLNAKQFSKVIQQEYAKSLKEIRNQLLIIYEKYAVEGTLTLSEMTKFNRLKNLQAGLTETMKETNKDVTKMMNKYHSVVYDDAFYRYSWSVDQASGVELEWGSPGQIKQIEQIKDIGKTQYIQAIKSLNANGIKRVNNTIIGGIMQGTSIQKMARDLKNALGISARDAMRIIRTETNRLSELGHYEEYLKAEKNGVKLKRQLLATLDTRTRAQSANMDGQISNDKGKFRYPNGQYYIPGNTGVAKWDINDRERTIEIIEGFEPRVRRAREDGVIPFTTFPEWAEKKKITKNIYGEKLFI
jgi:hypothetical protein